MYRNLFQGMDLPLIRVSLLFESHLNAECHGNAVNHLQMYERSMQYSLKHLVINWVQGISFYQNDLQIMIVRKVLCFLVCLHIKYMFLQNQYLFQNAPAVTKIHKQLETKNLLCF